MAERLHQLQFDELFQEAGPLDVTPSHSTGLQLPIKEKGTIRIEAIQLGRFVREVKDEVFAISPQAAARYLLDKVYTPFELFDQEETWVLLLNAKNKITHEVMIYRGTVNTAYIRVAELFKEAIRVNATGIILSHNHPSGAPAPSPEDIAITKRAKEAADLLGIELEDHIIVGKDTWVSLREEGIVFSRF
jgi:DNA repair protein RadC